MDPDQLSKFISEGFDSAKHGNALTIYSQIASHLEAGTIPHKSHYATGWIIYYALHQSMDKEIAGRKKMLANYLKLKVTVPHKLHSMILTEAIRLYKNAKDSSFNSEASIKDNGKNCSDAYNKDQKPAIFSIVAFSKLWDLANLREGDWRRKEFNGKRLSSTVEKLVTIYVDETEQTGKIPSDDFLTVLDKAQTEYSGSANILSQRAAVFSICGEKENAKRLLRKALLLSPGKFYLWSKLASLYDPEESPHLRVALLYKALKAPGPDQFKGRIRLSIADILASRGAFPQTLWELQRVKSTYETNGWHLPGNYATISRKIPAGTVASDPCSIYRKVEHLADDEIFRHLPPIAVTKTFHKNSAPDSTGHGYGTQPTVWRVTDDHGHNYWLHPQRFNLSPDIPLGTPLIIRVHDGKPVKADLA